MAETQPDLAAYQSDHDLIVGLVKDVGHLSGDVGKLTDAVNKKNDDHEGRIRILEDDHVGQKEFKTLEGKVEDNATWTRVWRVGISVFGFLLTIGVALLAIYHH